MMAPRRQDAAIEHAGLALHEPEVVRLGHVGVLDLHELEHLSLGHGGGRLGQDVHDPLVVQSDAVNRA